MIRPYKLIFRIKKWKNENSKIKKVCRGGSSWHVCMNVLFYILGVAIYSTPIAKLSKTIGQIFSSSVIGELQLGIVQ